jgi:RNA recognition motif-containing protein
MHIFIENLPDDVTEERLREFFDDFLRPAQPEIKLEYKDGRPTLATLTMAALTPQTATVFAKHFNKRWFGGKFIHVHASQFD